MPLPCRTRRLFCQGGQNAQRKTARSASFAMSANLWGVGLTLWFGLVAISPNTAHSATQLPPQAHKYYTALIKRPQAGTLFDRFWKASLEQMTFDELEAFLRAQQDNDKTSHTILLALCYAQQGAHEQALAAFRDVAQQQPTMSPELLYEKARLEDQQLHPMAALQDIDRALQRDTNNRLLVKLRMLQGEILLRTDQVDQALSTWKQLLQQGPDEVGLAEQIITRLVQARRYTEAVQLAQSELQRQSDPYQQTALRLRLADTYRRAQQTDEALATYREVLNAVGHQTWLEREVLSQIEAIFRSRDDLRGLAAHLTTLLQGESQRIHLRKRAALIALELGDVTGAKGQMEAILQLTPQDRTTQNDYIALLLRLQQYDVAIQAIEQVIRAHPQDPETYIQLAEAQHAASRPSEVTQALKRFLETAESSEAAFARVGRLYVRFEQWEAAEQTFREQLARYPDSMSAAEQLASFLYDRQRRDEARDMWRALAQSAPLDQLTRLAQWLSTRQEHALAFEIFASRLPVHASESQPGNPSGKAPDKALLRQAIQAAQLTQHFLAARQWCHAWMQQITDPVELEDAIRQAVSLIVAAGELDSEIAKLTANTDRSINDHCLLAALYEQRGDAQLADETLAQPHAETSPLLILQRVKLASERRDWPRAAALLASFIQSDEPHRSSYIARLVDLYERSLDDAHVSHWLQRWKATVSQSSIPWQREAHRLLSQGRPFEAVTSLRTAVAKFDEDVELKGLLARAYQQAGQLAEAERIYWELHDQAHEAPVTSSTRWITPLLQIAQERNQVDRLLQQFQERQRSHPSSVGPLLAQAEIYQATNQPAERSRVLREAVRRHPEEVTLLHLAAHQEEQAGHWQAALQLLQQAQPHDKSSKTQQWIARLLLTHDQTDEGMRQFASISQVAHDPEQALETALLLIEGRHWKHADQFLSLQLERHLDHPRLLYLAGITAEQSGRIDVAITRYLALCTPPTSGSIVSGSMPPPSSAMSLPMSLHAAGSPPIASAQLSGWVPSETLELLKMAELAPLAYQFQTDPKNAQLSIAQRLIPHDAQPLRQLAAVHLGHLANIASPTDCQRVKTQLQQLGLPPYDELWRYGPLRSDLLLSPQHLQSLASLEGTNDGLLGLWLVCSVYTSDYQPPLPLLELSERRFATSHPTLAHVASMLRATLDPAHLQTVMQRVEASLNSQSCNPVLLHACLEFSVISEQWGKLSAEATAHYRSVLRRLVAKLGDTPDRAAIVHTVLERVAQAEDPTTYFGILEDEFVLTSQRDPSQSPPVPLGSSPHDFLCARTLSGSMSDAWTLLGFDPLLADSLTGLAHSPWATPQRRSATVSALRELRSPVVRTLVAHELQISEIWMPAIQTLPSDAEPTVETLQLVAFLAAEHGHPELASHILQRVRQRSLSPEQARRIDLHLVRIAKPSLANSTPDSPPFDVQPCLRWLGDQASWLTREAAAIQALMRLSHLSWGPEDRRVLAGFMHQYNLSKEAQQMQRVSSHRPTPAWSGSPRDFLGVRAVEQWMIANQPAQAVDLLVQELLAVAWLVQGPPSDFAEAMQRAERARHETQTNDLTMSVTNRLQQDARTVPAQMLNYGLALEFLGHPSEALTLYNEWLTAHPHHHTARQRRLLFVARSEGSEFQEFCQSLSPVDYEDLVAHYLLLAPRQLVKTGDLKSLLRIIEAALAAKQTPLKSRAQLATLYQAARQHGPSELSAYCHIARQLVTSPILGRTAFAHLAAQPNVDPNDLRELATICLSAQGQFPMLRFPPREVDGLLRTDDASLATSQQAADASISPEEYLVRTAYHANQLMTLSQELISQLPYETERSFTTSLLELYTSAPDSFSEVALRCLTDHSFRNNTASFGHIVRIAQDRQMAVDLTPVVIRYLRQQLKTGSELGWRELHDYFRQLATRDLEQLQGLLYAATAEFLGPPTQWVSTITSHVERWEKGSERNAVMRGIARGPLSDPFHTEHQITNPINLFREFAEQQLRDRLTAIAMANVLDDAQLWEPLGLSVDIPKWVIQDDLASSVDYLAKTSFVAPLSDFRPLRLLPNHSQATALGRVVVAIWERPHLRGTYRSQVEENLPATFGRELFLACLRDTPRDAVLTLLAQHGSQVQALPLDRQYGLARFVVDVLDHQQARKPDANGGPIAETALPHTLSTTQDVEQWLTATLLAHHRDCAQGFLKATTLREAGLSEVPRWRDLERHLNPLLLHDMGSAINLLEHVTTLAQQQQRSRKPSDVDKVLRAHLAKRLYPADKQLSLPFLVQCCNQPSLSAWLLLTGYAPQYWQYVQNDPAVGTALVSEWLRTLQQPSRQPINLAVWDVAMLDTISALRGRPTERNAIRQAIAQHAASLAVAWDHASDAIMPHASGPDRSHEAIEGYYLSQLTNDALPVPYRLLLADRLATSLPEIPFTWQEQGVELLMEAWKSTHDPYLNGAQHLLERFVAQQASPAWTAAADALLAHVLVRLREQEGSVPFQEETPRVLYDVLRLALRRGDLSAAQALLRTPIARHADTLALLVSHSQFDLALQVARRERWDLLEVEPPWHPYTESLHAALPQFLARLESPSKQFAAQTLLALRPDPADTWPQEAPHDLQRPGLAWEARVDALADQFLTIDFGNSELRETILGQLAVTSHAQYVLLPAIRAALEGVSINGLFADSPRQRAMDPLETRRKALLLSQLQQALIRSEQFEPLYEQCRTAPAVVPTLLQQFHRVVQADLPDASADWLWKLAQFYRDLAFRPSAIQGMFHGDTGLLLLLHHAAGRGVELQNWLDAEQETIRRNAAHLDIHTYAQWLARYIGPATPDNQPSRVALLGDYFRSLPPLESILAENAFVRDNRPFASRDAWRPFLVHGVVLPREMPTMVEEVASRVPHPDMVWGGGARCLLEAPPTPVQTTAVPPPSQPLAPALAWLQRAIDHCHNQGDPMTKMRLAWWLQLQSDYTKSTP